MNEDGFEHMGPMIIRYGVIPSPETVAVLTAVAIDAVGDPHTPEDLLRIQRTVEVSAALMAGRIERSGQ